MVNTRDAAQVLDHDFLETRCKILEIAATLDRIDRRRHAIANTPTRAWASCAVRSRRSWSRGLAVPRRCSTFFRSNMSRTGASG